MTTDRELLELAAKAAGIEGRYQKVHGFAGVENGDLTPWNPLTDDGTALRLAVKLGLLIDIDGGTSSAASDGTPCNDQCERHVDNNNDPHAATRRAIVKAAAEIGRYKND